MTFKGTPKASLKVEAKTIPVKSERKAPSTAQDSAGKTGSSADAQHYDIASERDYLDTTARDWKRVVAMAILYDKATTSHSVNLAMFAIVSRRRAALGMPSVTEEKRMQAAMLSKTKAEVRVQTLHARQEKKIAKAKTKASSSKVKCEIKKEENLFDDDGDVDLDDSD